MTIVRRLRDTSNRTKLVVAVLVLLLVAGAVQSARPDEPESAPASSVSPTDNQREEAPSTVEIETTPETTAEDLTQTSITDQTETITQANNPVPTQQTSPSPTTVTPSDVSGLQLDALLVREDPPIAGYSRNDWSHWNDINGSGCDTRKDVLKAQVIGVPQLDPYDPSRCTIVEGDWYSAYDGVFYSGSPSELHIDHIVALSAAWRSGATTWNAVQRKTFANDPRNLVAVTASSNQSKSDDDVADWRPIRSAWCATATAIIEVKTIYQLSVDPRERDALKTMIATCGQPDQVPFGGRPTTGTTTAIPVTTLAPIEPNPPANSSQPVNPGDTKNCADFKTYPEAKAWFDTYYPYYGDVAGLDRDGDLKPCESLSGAPN